MKNIFSICCLLILIATSCYKDQGNYDYQILNEVKIENISLLYYAKIDEALDIEPKLTFSLEDESNFGYELYINNELYSTDKDININIVDIEDKSKILCQYYVIDQTSGAKYSKYFEIKIAPKYFLGWVVLTKKAGGSDLAFVERKSEIVDEKEEITYEVLEDCYFKENNELIPGECIGLRQHWSRDKNTPPALLVLRRGGSLDIDGNTFHKTVELNDFFLDGKAPDNLKVKDEVYCNNYSYIITEDGQVYTRKFEDNTLLQTGFYNSQPISYSKGLNVTQTLNGIGDQNFCLFFDAKNKRYLTSNDYGDLSVYSSNKPNFSNLHDLKKDVVFADCYSSFSIIKRYVAINKDVDNYSVQEWQLMKNWFLGWMFMSATENPLNYTGVINDETIFYKTRQSDSKLYITEDAKLHIYDIKTKEPAVLFHEFPSKIVKIASHHSASLLLVGLENGELYAVKVTNETIGGKEEKIEYKTKIDGEIVDIRFKFQREDLAGA